MSAMRTETPQPVRLAEYRPPAYLIDEVFLDFALEPSATRVKAVDLRMEPPVWSSTPPSTSSIPRFRPSARTNCSTSSTPAPATR